METETAKKFIKMLPKTYQNAAYFWGTVGVLCLPIGIAVWIFYRWWAGAFMVFIVFPAIVRGNNKYIAQAVLDHAGKNRWLFELLDTQNLLVFKNLQP